MFQVDMVIPIFIALRFDILSLQSLITNNQKDTSVSQQNQQKYLITSQLNARQMSHTLINKGKNDLFVVAYTNIARILDHVQQIRSIVSQLTECVQNNTYMHRTSEECQEARESKKLAEKKIDELIVTKDDLNEKHVNNDEEGNIEEVSCPEMV